MSTEARVYVLILNWNGWRDTIECLESVFRLDYPDFRVIVCDNASEDGSIEKIEAWARGEVAVTLPEDNPLKRLSSPPIPKPIPYIDYDRAQAERGGDPSDGDPRLILIRTGRNLGFAGGNNVGLRYALARGDFDYVWLLNNDTVVEPDALRHLAARMQERPDAGMCGSTLLRYDRPDTVQALGGVSYGKWFGAIKAVGPGRTVGQFVDTADVERRLSYIIGASMLVSRSFLEEIGLLCEDYFIYYEELDWSVRARGRYSLSYSADSRVYHKEGASIGSSADPMSRSFAADRYGIRNRIAFTRRHFPRALPTIYLGLGVAVLNRLRRRQWDRAWMIVKAMAGIDSPLHHIGRADR